MGFDFFHLAITLSTPSETLWTLNFCKEKFTFSGFADFWREKHTDVDGNNHDFVNADAHQSFGKSLEILRAVLEQYPDSLGAFILEESANALYQGADSIYMKDIDGIRKRFPNRLLEIEMIRRLKPHSLVKQIKKIQIENEYNIDFDLDSLVNEMEKQQKL